MIAWLQKHAPTRGKTGQFLYGGLISLFGIFLMAAIGLILNTLLTPEKQVKSIIINAVFLSLMLSIRRLSSAAKQIETALAQNDILEGRRLLSWHLVSRPTRELNKPEITAATIESVAENTSDSIIAPIIYYILFGIPGALIYRYANTADAMLGYHTPEKEWLGKIPARLDDLLNLIPARITAMLLILSTLISRSSTKNAISIWWSDRYKTESPNAGHPMSAVAGALGVILAKAGHYQLNASGRDPAPEDINRSIKLMCAAVGLFTFAITVYAFLVA